MSIKQTLEKRLIKFGENNSPTVVAMSIAAAKGIFRPTFTMMDEKESYETKRYTAIREGLTEVIAIPVYYLSGVLMGHIAKKLAKPEHYMSKNMLTKYNAGDKSQEVINSYAHAEKLAKVNLPKIKTNAAFAGVCASALFIIPCACSAIIKPIMKKLETKNNSNIQENNFNNVVKPNTAAKNNFKSRIYTPLNNNYGMKVGGV